MNTSSTITTIFSPLITLEGAGIIYTRKGSSPAPYCQTLLNLTKLETTLQINASRNELVDLLSFEEQQIFTNFKYAKRRKEWLGGRLTAKLAALHLLQSETTPAMMPELSILPTENGSPTLSCSNLPTGILPELSISHSDRFAVAMAVQGESCGVDIQKISETTVRVADRFSEPSELKMLQENASWLSTKERLTLLWSAKEALKKALLKDQPVIFQGVTLDSIYFDRLFTMYLHFPGDQNRAAKVTAVILEDCILAHTIVRSGNA